MNTNARIMLDALQHSANEGTRESATALVTGTKLPWAPEGRNAEEMATTGILGDFIKTVMTGDYLAAYGAADVHNQRILRGILGPDNDRW